MQPTRQGNGKQHVDRHQLMRQREAHGDQRLQSRESLEGVAAKPQKSKGFRLVSAPMKYGSQLVNTTMASVGSMHWTVRWAHQRPW